MLHTALYYATKDRIKEAYIAGDVRLLKNQYSKGPCASVLCAYFFLCDSIWTQIFHRENDHAILNRRVTHLAACSPDCLSCLIRLPPSVLSLSEISIQDAC